MDLLVNHTPRLRAVGLLAGVALLTALALATAPSAEAKKCSRGSLKAYLVPGSFSVKRTSCKNGRRVARSFLKKFHDSNRSNCAYSTGVLGRRVGRNPDRQVPQEQGAREGSEAGSI